MKERPIIFSGSMVRAILEGRKSMTRRVMKPQPVELCGVTDWKHFRWCPGANQPDIASRSPYGVPGDRLWVRETWCQKFDDGMPVYNKDGNLDPSCCYYRATEAEHIIKDDGNGGTEYRADGTEASPWSPSIFMPRRASRIMLEVTGVRVERLQDITEEDAVKEGCDGLDPETYSEFSAVDEFRGLWNFLNLKRGFGWEVNPYVWVVEFRRVGG